MSSYMKEVEAPQNNEHLVTKLYKQNASKGDGVLPKALKEMANG